MGLHANLTRSHRPPPRDRERDGEPCVAAATGDTLSRPGLIEPPTLSRPGLMTLCRRLACRACLCCGGAIAVLLTAVAAMCLLPDRIVMLPVWAGAPRAPAEARPSPGVDRLERAAVLVSGVLRTAPLASPLAQRVLSRDNPQLRFDTYVSVSPHLASPAIVQAIYHPRRFELVDPPPAVFARGGYLLVIWWRMWRSASLLQLDEREARAACRAARRPPHNRTACEADRAYRVVLWMRPDVFFQVAPGSALSLDLAAPGGGVHRGVRFVPGGWTGYRQLNYTGQKSGTDLAPGAPDLDFAAWGDRPSMLSYLTLFERLDAVYEQLPSAAAYSRNRSVAAMPAAQPGHGPGQRPHGSRPSHGPATAAANVTERALAYARALGWLDLGHQYQTRKSPPDPKQLLHAGCRLRPALMQTEGCLPMEVPYGLAHGLAHGLADETSSRHARGAGVTGFAVSARLWNHMTSPAGMYVRLVETLRDPRHSKEWRIWGRTPQYRVRRLLCNRDFSRVLCLLPFRRR